MSELDTEAYFSTKWVFYSAHGNWNFLSCRDGTKFYTGQVSGFFTSITVGIYSCLFQYQNGKAFLNDNLCNESVRKLIRPETVIKKSSIKLPDKRIGNVVYTFNDPKYLFVLKITSITEMGTRSNNYRFSIVTSDYILKQQ